MNYIEALKDITGSFSARHLWQALGWQDIRARYRRSTLGPIWITISMAVTVGAMGPLYGSLFNHAPSEFIPHLALGMIFWAFIATPINEFGDAFFSSAHYLRQMKLPLTVFILRVCYRQFIILGHNILIYPIVMIVIGKSINGNILYLFPAIIIVTINLIWIGIVIGIFCTRYRDMYPVVSSIMTLMFFVTPIVWQIDQLPPNRRLIAESNPLAILLELMRQPVLGITPAAHYWIFASLMAVLGTFFSILLLARCRHRVTYWL